MSNILGTDRVIITSGNSDYIMLESAADIYLDTGAAAKSVFVRDESNATALQFHNDGALYIKETAAAQGDTATLGQLWVKNDDPNVLMYTDGDGTDFTVDITAV